MGCHTPIDKNRYPILLCSFEYGNEEQKNYCIKLRDNFNYEKTIKYIIESNKESSFAIKLQIKKKIYDIQTIFNDSNEEMEKTLQNLYNKLDKFYPEIIEENVIEKKKIRENKKRDSQKV